MVGVVMVTALFLRVRLEHFDWDWKDDGAVLFRGYRVQGVQVSAHQTLGMRQRAA